MAQRNEEKETKVGGLVTPDTAKEKPMTARVVAVGSGRMLDDGNRAPLEVAKGAKVLIGKYAGSEVELNGVDYLVVREDDVLGIVGWSTSKQVDRTGPSSYDGEGPFFGSSPVAGPRAR